MSTNVRHDEEAQRFIIPLEEGKAILDYDKRGSELDYKHTYVPEAGRGRGIASRLADRALEYAKENGYKVKPSCPFVRSYIDRHEEYASIVA